MRELKLLSLHRVSKFRDNDNRGEGGIRGVNGDSISRGRIGREEEEVEEGKRHAPNDDGSGA